MTDAEVASAYRANVLFDAHRDDPTFGYRYLHQEARDAGQAMSARTAWSICSAGGWWSVFGKRQHATFGVGWAPAAANPARANTGSRPRCFVTPAKLKILEAQVP